MPIRIGEGIMHLEIDGRVVATATERAGGWWEVTYWPRFFDRNQAITALTVTGLLESGRRPWPGPTPETGMTTTSRWVSMVRSIPGSGGNPNTAEQGRDFRTR